MRDKLFSQQILAENKLPVPKTMLAKFPINIPFVKERLGMPIVVKTISGTEGKGVFLIEDEAKLEDLMNLIQSTSPDANIILQEYIESSHGRDLRVLTIGGRVVACMKRTAQGDDFKANFSTGGTVECHPVTPEIEWLATATARTLNLDIAGIDLLFAGDHFKICEANSAPAFKGLESCCNIDVPYEIYKYISLRLGEFEHLCDYNGNGHLGHEDAAKTKLAAI